MSRNMMEKKLDHNVKLDLHQNPQINTFSRINNIQRNGTSSITNTIVI